MRRPIDLYPAQVISGDAGYPHGKARNVLVLNDGTGTPLEEKWVNDDWGFKQALLVAAGITPNGAAETVTASQLLDAIKYLTRHIQGGVIIDGSLDVNSESEFDGEARFDAAAVFAHTLQLLAAAVATFDGAVTFNGAFNANRPLTLGPSSGIVLSQRGLTLTPAGIIAGTAGDADTQIPARFQDSVRFSGDGRLVRRYQTAPNADASFSFSDGDRIVIPATVTGPHAYTLLEDFAAETGAEIKIINWSVFDHFITSAGTPVAAIGNDTSSLPAYDWRPGVIDFAYHHNGLLSRWLPIGRPDP
jgi:hypothetical protein